MVVVGVSITNVGILKRIVKNEVIIECYMMINTENEREENVMEKSGELEQNNIGYMNWDCKWEAKDE